MNTQNPTNNNLPLDLQHPGGFVEEVYNYILETAVCPQPMFALGAALTLAGTLYGRKVQSEDGQRTNILVQAVGYTSCGKDGPLKAISRILDSCDASRLRLGQVTSDSAIEFALKRQPRLCLCLDESGYYFANATDAKAKGSPQHAIKPALLELWSCANARWVGKQRVPKDGKTEIPPLVIDNPHLCIYGTTQPQIFFEGLSKNDLRDGWLARNLFFISKTRPMPVLKPMKEIPNSIRGVVYAYKGEVVNGEKVNGEMGSGEVVTVPTDEDAMKVFQKFNERIYAKMMEADKCDRESNYLYGKALENARRIALILGVSAAPDRFRAKVKRAHAEYACNLVGFLISQVIDELEATMSENADEKAKKRILQLIAKAGKKGVTRNELTRKTQFIRRGLREEYLEDLLESGLVTKRLNDDAHVHSEIFFHYEYVKG